MQNTTLFRHGVWVNDHRTTISLEGPFWDALNEIAELRNVSIEKLVEQIDQGRSGHNLSSAIRIFVLTYFQMPQSAQKKPQPSIVLESLLTKQFPDSDKRERDG